MKINCLVTTTLMVVTLAVALANGGCACLKVKMGLNMAGIWTLEVATPGGIGTPLFHLKQEGNALSGAYQGAFGDAPLRGEINGIDFVIEFTSSGLPMTYTGHVVDDRMEGIIDFGGQGKGTFVGYKK